ncbi:MAG TPA: hypothetical protein VHA33_22965 [Candidatus Angelobacter sp.]|jgi:hypothetical protein|nr:hypothetical protein [Candidatus Angelobacter sp.]
MSKPYMFVVKAVRCLAVLMFVSIAMYGQVARTFVSGINADDSNPCTNIAPCRTFAAAMAKTSAGGEIDALDTAEYGPVTITKAITIDGGGQVASIQADGVNGIVVSAGANDKVILRNVRISGSNTGLNGIRFLSGGQLTIDKCEIFGFTLNGVDISQGSSAQSWVTNTNIGMIGSVGIMATTTAGIVTLGIDKVRVEWSNKGIDAAFHSRVTVNDSFVQNAASIGIEADGDAIIVINGSVIDLNGSGVETTNVSGIEAFAYVSNSEIAFNSTGFNELAGRINTFGNNRFIANGSDGPVRPPIAMK